MGHATVFRRGAKIIVHSSSTTTTGIGIASPPFEVLHQDAPLSILGEAVRRALSASRSGVPHPADPASVAKPLYDAAGVKSWSAFVRGAACCEVTEDDSVLYFDPTKNKGAGGGFQPIEGQESPTLPSGASAEEIGQTVQAALAISEGP